MKKNTLRLISLLLAAILCLSLTACGDKAASAPGSGNETQTNAAANNGSAGGAGDGVAPTAQELGYGYLSEYSDLEGIELNYIASANVAGGKLYLRGDYYDEAGSDNGTRLYERDLATGVTKRISLPELVQEENTNEYIQQMSILSDGSGYWLLTDQYTFDSSLWEEDPIVFEDETAEPTEDAEPVEVPDVPEEPEAEGLRAGGTAEYTVALLSDLVPIDPDDGNLVPVDPEEPVQEPDIPETPEEPPIFESNETYYLKKCDMTGKVLLEKDMTEVTRGMDYFYSQAMALDGEGNVYMACDQTILRFDSDGNRLEDVDAGDMYVQSMVTAGDGTVLVSGWDMESGGLKIFRVEGSGLTALEIEGLNQNGRCDLFPGSGSSILINDGTYLSALNLESGTLDRLLSWLDSDVNGNNISAIASPDQDTVLVLLGSYRRSIEEFVFEMGTLHRVPASEIPVRTILTLGAQYLDSDIQDAIIRYNRENDTYRISLVDYSQYNTEDNYNGGAEQMERDIISGACPDILYLSSIGNAERIISKGALADLTPLMEQDGEFSMADLIEAPFRAYSRDGKYYGLPWSFSLSTMYASARLVGDRESWTLSDLKEIIDGLDPDVQVMMWATQADFLNSMVYYNINRFVNYADNTCDFSSQEFMDLLEIAKRLPEDYSFYDSGMDGAEMAYSSSDEFSMLQAGELLMANGYGGDDSYSIREMYRLYTRENGIVRIGYPTSEGNGAMLNVYNAMAISARCADPAGAWSFLKTMLSDEIQENLWSLPVSRKAFDKVLAQAMERDSYQDENGETVYIDSTGYIGNTEYPMGELTQEQADAFRAYVDGAGIMGSYDVDIMEIITDEAGAFFAGDKTAQEVADLIQNRVTIYLGETG